MVEYKKMEIKYNPQLTMWNPFNPQHPNISMYILPTVLYTFLKVLSRRICLTMKSFFSW